MSLIETKQVSAELSLKLYSNEAHRIERKGITYYIERETPGLDRRVFRYENNLIGSNIEFCYYLEFINSNRPRYYGFANKQLPPTCEV